MDIESYRTYCLNKPGVTEEFPFDNETLVFKVMGKIFALTNVDDFLSINVKCDPEEAIEYRERYAEVIPGYHMNKKHWNTVSMEGDLQETLVKQMIDDSYRLVVSGLPKQLKEDLSQENQ